MTTPKKIIPIIIGDTKLPSKIPILNQILFKGVKIGEFNNPKIKKRTEIINDQILMFPSFNNGNNETIKKNVKKTIPKLLFELIFIFSLLRSKSMKVASSYPLC